MGETKLELFLGFKPIESVMLPISDAFELWSTLLYTHIYFYLDIPATPF
jgi:hypothetical protein